jgi:hypothetical protein
VGEGASLMGLRPFFLPLFTGVRGIEQPVEKLLNALLRALFEGSTPRYCSVLAVFPECLDTIWPIEGSDSDFFNRLMSSANFALTALKSWI